METQRKYKTKQREIVAEYLKANDDRYLSVDDVWSGIASGGTSVGRSTVYRCMEAMASEGSVLKAVAPGGESRYRLAGGGPSGQLVCLGCGCALPLDCHMVADFSEHVLEQHAFEIDPSRTVLYGLCGDCMETDR